MSLYVSEHICLLYGLSLTVMLLEFHLEIVSGKCCEIRYTLLEFLAVGEILLIIEYQVSREAFYEHERHPFGVFGTNICEILL